ncbi:MAG: phosphate uptake regulator PhoU, partial [Thaumarchaeota archaeon]|nr:phosphate uptake regulator PhoU [Nitrososphaerota archaeon]
ITSFLDMDMELATSVKERDSEVDRLYRAVLKGSMDEKDVRCALMAVLVMRYLERIADHTTYIADAVSYVVKGRR